MLSLNIKKQGPLPNEGRGPLCSSMPPNIKKQGVVGAACPHLLPVAAGLTVAAALAIALALTLLLALAILLALLLLRTTTTGGTDHGSG